ncbi:porin [Massilia yuzhufengensis]|uniref:Outer membrane protein (Porin) n=1 Tax=Massilia yuzhufengensis TaxID=1164594 RepID=A0A1I1DR86_9BURK|nr:porin [Massilia yuzhufengensis]SFB77317.1 Outer membrane protein (porin) [Massilia yuzhufengensis]
MKHSLMAVALLGAFAAGTVQAQTAVQIYGTVDAGIIKRSGQTLNIGKRASNTLGFKGTEELGNGLKALFQLEMRYEPDTGTNEIGANGTQRPLFQGQSRVGLQGDFGMVRIGRGLTPLHETIGAFDPFHASPSPAGFWTDLSVAGYTSQPLDVAGYSNNRFSNAVWYNSPLQSGFQVNAAVATKENSGGPAVVGRGTAAAPQYPAGAEASANPFSITGTYNNGPAAFMAGYERNAIESKIWSIGASLAATPELKLMGTYSKQDQEHSRIANANTTAWVLGANYTMGPGKLLAGYGQKDVDGLQKVKQFSLGYEYSLSKRTYLYVDASRKKGTTAIPSTVNHYDVGVNHSF